jgi:hypothetical protein
VMMTIFWTKKTLLLQRSLRKNPKELPMKPRIKNLCGKLISL